MKRITLTLLVVLAALLAVPAALADNPHFVSASAFVNSQGQLVCEFRLAGFGSTSHGQETTVSCSSTVTISWGGGGCGGGGTYTQSTYGYNNVNNLTTGTYSNSIVSPSLNSYPGPCLAGLTSVSYSDVALTDSTIGGKSAYPIPGTFTRTF
jgi:hypothetical protein